MPQDVSEKEEYRIQMTVPLSRGRRIFARDEMQQKVDLNRRSTTKTKDIKIDTKKTDETSLLNG